MWSELVNQLVREMFDDRLLREVFGPKWEDKTRE